MATIANIIAAIEPNTLAKISNFSQIVFWVCVSFILIMECVRDVKSFRGGRKNK